MGYIVALVLLVLVVPLLFMFLSRRASSHGGAGHMEDRGMTVSEPSSDQPTPRADATNQVSDGNERKLPPG